MFRGTLRATRRRAWTLAGDPKDRPYNFAVLWAGRHNQFAPEHAGVWEMRTVAEYFAEELRGAGVERVYGLPGGENVEVLDAIRRCGIDFILVKNESSACFMAATDARLTGKIGVALTTLGPGAANATAGLAHAYLDRAPVLLITAANDPEVSGKHSHQVIDLSARLSSDLQTHC